MNNEEMIDRLAGCADDVRTLFGDLSEEQFNWKSNPETWSVGQCIDHLVVTNRKEVPILKAALGGQHNKTFWEKLPVLPKLGGDFIVKAVNPENKKKNKAPAAFQPSSSDINTSVIDDYVALSATARELISKSEGMETAKMVVTSPIASFFTYSLAHAFEILVFHDRRHLDQAKRVMDSAMFPV